MLYAKGLVPNKNSNTFEDPYIALLWNTTKKIAICNETFLMTTKSHRKIFFLFLWQVSSVDNDSSNINTFVTAK